MADSFLLQGKLFVRGDSKIFRFQKGKSESLFLQRQNPRRVAWTVLFRRSHRKGISEVRPPSEPALQNDELLGSTKITTFVAVFLASKN